MISIQILNNIEIYEKPVPRTKKISHHTAKFKAGQENRIVEKQFGYSFKVQVLAVIHLNTQLKVHVDLVHIIFPQTEFSNTFHKYRSIKHSSKQSNKVAHEIHSI